MSPNVEKFLRGFFGFLAGIAALVLFIAGFMYSLFNYGLVPTGLVAVVLLAICAGIGSAAEEPKKE